MPLSQDQLNQYRAQTFRTAPGLRLTSADQAVDFVNQRGYIFFWPIKNVMMPSLWAAVAGDRPVADAHDDPGHVSWNWKDSLLGKRRWFYGRVLRKRNSMISLNILPYFYALSPNYGNYEEDYLIDYEAGSLPLASRLIYEALLKDGPLDTITLRKKAGLTSRASDTEFNHALDNLQTTFRILPTGVADTGAWHYAFIYDIVARHFPDLTERAHPITEADARQKLIQVYLESLGVAAFKDLQSFFCTQPLSWDPKRLETDLQKMEGRGQLRQSVAIENLPGTFVVSASLL